MLHSYYADRISYAWLSFFHFLLTFFLPFQLISQSNFWNFFFIRLVDAQMEAGGPAVATCVPVTMEDSVILYMEAVHVLQVGI